jgi:hypothetical protein
MPHHYIPATGRELKYALTKGLRIMAHELLVTQAGQDISDDMRAIEDYRFEVQELGRNQFVIRAKACDETGTPLNKPAEQFEVTITGGG